MPKTKRSAQRPATERVALANELRQLYGGALSLQDLMETLGYKDPEAARRWVRENKLDAVVLNGGRKKWLVSDVARILDNSKIRGMAV